MKIYDLKERLPFGDLFFSENKQPDLRNKLPDAKNNLPGFWNNLPH